MGKSKTDLLQMARHSVDCSLGRVKQLINLFLAPPRFVVASVIIFIFFLEVLLSIRCSPKK